MMSMQWPEEPGQKAMEEHVIAEHVDRAIHLTGLVVRLVGYALVSGLANSYDLGQPVLTGILLGDLAASLASLLWQGRERIAQLLAELGLLGVVFLWVRGDVVWPVEPATRAILLLAALGVFATRTGGSMLTRLGPGENGFA